MLALKTSAEALADFADGALDFVYVDGNHQPGHVAHDLSGWWPKVRPGGILAGHDIICPGCPDGGWGRFVQPAVRQLCYAEGVPYIYLVRESDDEGHWSFYLEKP